MGEVGCIQPADEVASPIETMRAVHSNETSLRSFDCPSVDTLKLIAYTQRPSSLLTHLFEIVNIREALIKKKR